jgi:hypothetical protein
VMNADFRVAQVTLLLPGSACLFPRETGGFAVGQQGELFRLPPLSRRLLFIRRVAFGARSARVCRGHPAVYWLPLAAWLGWPRCCAYPRQGPLC